MLLLLISVFIVVLLLKTDGFSINEEHNRRTAGETLHRREFLSKASSLSVVVAAFTTGSLVAPSNAIFDGGVGGLGKTKPETGVVFYRGSEPTQDSTTGRVGGEITSPSTGKPILVGFNAPKSWPLLTTSSGLEARDLQHPESAFIQVIEGTSNNNRIISPKKQLPSAITANVFGSQGKYGAYGTPTDIKYKKVPSATADGDEDENSFARYLVTFTAYTPAMRESERKVYVTCKKVEQDWILLITGTTLPRFKSQDKLLQQVSESFLAITAPWANAS